MLGGVSLQSGLAFKSPQLDWRKILVQEQGIRATYVGCICRLEFNGRWIWGEKGWCIIIVCLWALFTELESHVEVLKTSSGHSCIQLDINGRESYYKITF